MEVVAAANLQLKKGLVAKLQLRKNLEENLVKKYPVKKYHVKKYPVKKYHVKKYQEKENQDVDPERKLMMIKNQNVDQEENPEENLVKKK